MKNITDISIQSLLFLILAGGLIILIFYIIRNYILPLLRKNKQEVKKYWKKIEIISWLIYTIILIIVLLRINLYLSVCLIGLIVLLGWGHLKNILAGIIIKITDQFIDGELISGEFGEGSIKSIWIATTEISNDKGELISIPNHVLRSSIVKHLHEKSSLKINTFNVLLDAGHSIQSIKEIIVNCPYVAVNQKIIVERLSANECSIKVTLIDSSFEEDVYLYIRDKQIL